MRRAKNTLRWSVRPELVPTTVEPPLSGKIASDFNHIRVRDFILNGAPDIPTVQRLSRSVAGACAHHAFGGRSCRRICRGRRVGDRRPGILRYPSRRRAGCGQPHRKQLDTERRQFRRARRQSERDAPERDTADRRLHHSGQTERRAAGPIGVERHGKFQRRQSAEHGEHETPTPAFRHK